MKKQQENYFKTTIVIYTDYDPRLVEIEDLARDATRGEAICDGTTRKVVKKKDLSEGVASFFNVLED